MLNVNGTDISKVDVRHNGEQIAVSKIVAVHDGTETEVWGDGVTVTYISNGVGYEEKVAKGSDILHPQSFIPTLSGATFLGWTDSATVLTPLTEKTASENITLYALFKYADKASYNEYGYKDQQWMCDNNKLITIVANVDGTKYSALRTKLDFYWGKAGSGYANWYPYIKHGSRTSVYSYSCSVGANATHFSDTRDIPLDKVVDDIAFYVGGGSNSVGTFNNVGGTATLIGRTIAG